MKINREDFEALAELLNANVYMKPGYNDSRLRFSFPFAGPKGEVKVDVHAVGLTQVGDTFYYARDNDHTHVRIRFPEDVHLHGAGSRSWYPGTYEDPYHRVRNLITELVS